MAFEVLQSGNLPAVAAAAGTTTFLIGEVPTREAEGVFNVEKVSVTAPSLVTGVNTNSGTFNVRQLRAGAAQATLGSLALVAGTNLAAETEVTIALTGTLNVNAGDALDVQYVQIGTGLALPAGVQFKAEVD